MSTKKVDLREPRMIRATNDVMKNYRVEALESQNPNEAKFHVSRKNRGTKDPYLVVIIKDWSANPTCTCPDATSRPELNGYCKHTIATMMMNEDYKFQLMELFIME